MTQPQLHNFDSDTKRLLTDVQKVAEQHNFKIYVVGGFVRDLIVGQPGKDIDFVVIGDALHFAKELYTKQNIKRSKR